MQAPSSSAACLKMKTKTNVIVMALCSILVIEQCLGVIVERGESNRTMLKRDIYACVGIEF